MSSDGITRRRFMGRTAAVGLGVLAHPTFNAKVFGANERIVLGIIGAGAWVAGTWRISRIWGPSGAQSVTCMT